MNKWPTRTGFRPFRRTAETPRWRALKSSSRAARGARLQQTASGRPGARGAANARREWTGWGARAALGPLLLVSGHAEGFGSACREDRGSRHQRAPSLGKP